MTRVSVSVAVPGRVVEAEALWYDRHRWPAWIDGFGHVVKLEGGWPQAGARLVWASRTTGRGVVAERVTAYEPRAGQTVAVEDERLSGVQTVAFEPAGDDVRVSLSLDYSLKRPRGFAPLLPRYFVRRAMRDSMRRTLARFGHERRAELS